MTSNQTQAYLDDLVQRLKEARLTPEDAVRRAFALGCETERMDAMHHACEEYSRARAAREASFRR